MITQNFTQSSAEWHLHRATHFNASDAPAMLGASSYKTRSQLLHEKATGITPDIDPATQARFDDGHRFEALARPLAEKMIGEDLYPVTGSEGKLSASFDGLTMLEDTCFEHKTLNNSLRGITNPADLPEQYRIQMEQQMMVSGAGRCLFMASTWDDNDTLIEEMHVWYVSNNDLRQRIIQGWDQFSLDLENYVPADVVIKPIGSAIMDLPALTVQATGMVTRSNLPEFKAAADSYIANINTELVTDQDFADAETTVKFCKATEDKLEVTKSAILAQTADIDEVIRTVTHIQVQLRDKRLMLDKLVKSEKEARKVALVSQVRESFAAHYKSLEEGIRPIVLMCQMPDFGGAIKGLKSLASMQDVLDGALAKGKIEADSISRDVRAKLDWCKEHAEGQSHLFPDLQQIIVKPFEDFTLTITSRIEKSRADEAARLDDERIRMESAATAKAEREAAAKMAQEEARIRAEERAKADAEKREEIINKAVEEARIRVEERAKAEETAKDKIAQSVDKTPELQDMVDKNTKVQEQPCVNVIPLRTEDILDRTDVIGAFLKVRSFSDESRIRAILIEFVKFDGGFKKMAE